MTLYLVERPQHEAPANNMDKQPTENQHKFNDSYIMLESLRVPLALLLAMTAVASVASEIDYPAITIEQIIPAQDIVLTDAEQDAILVSAYGLMPETELGRVVQEMKVTGGQGGFLAVDVQFEPEVVSPNRTESYVAQCFRAAANEAWNCQFLRQSAQQMLPGGSSPILIEGPIDELSALDAVATLRAFVDDNLQQPPELFEIQSMSRSESYFSVATEQWDKGIEVVAHIGAYKVGVSLNPIADNSEELQVTAFNIYGNLDANAMLCDAATMDMRARLSEAAELNQNNIQLDENQIEELLSLIRPMLSSPELLTRFDPPKVITQGETSYINIHFEPFVQSNEREVQAYANCNNSSDHSSWDCSVREIVALKVAGQDDPVHVMNGLTDEEVFLMVQYLQQMLPNHPELDAVAGDLRVSMAMSNATLDDEGLRIAGPITVYGQLRDKGALTVVFDREALTAGEILVEKLQVDWQ